MKHDRKIYIGIALIVLGFLPIIIAAFLSIRTVVAEQEALSSDFTQALLLSERLRYMDSTQTSLMPIYVLTGDSQLVDVFSRQHESFVNLLGKLRRVEDDPQTLKSLARIEELSQLSFNHAAPAIAMKQKGASIEEVSGYLAREAGPYAKELADMLNDLVATETADRELAKRHVETVIHWVEIELAMLSGIALLLVGLIGRIVVAEIRQKKLNDETLLELMEKERRLSIARKETVEVVSHDLKNPLGSIKMSLELLRQQMSEGSTDQEMKEVLDIAERSTASMQCLIHDLLDHAKIESGYLVLEPRDCSVGEMIEDLVLRFQPLAREKNVQMNMKMPSGELLVHCDGGRIEQVLSNLIGNSLKFTPTGGKIEIAARAVADEVIVSVSDSGKGISGEQCEHIFDRFWQVRESAKQGTGLGLAISKSIIDAHKGRIWVESVPERGSTFCFALSALNVSKREVQLRAFDPFKTSVTKPAEGQV